MKVKECASKCCPHVEEKKPIAIWYTIPNRNRQLEYHDEWVSVRVMPQSGTVRILPAQVLSYREFENRVWDAFREAGLSIKDCDRVVQTLVISAKHRVFPIGLVTPSKIKHYRESLGITLSADGSHPNCIEVNEEWPTWIKPVIEAISEYAEQIGLHLSVQRNINESFKAFTEAIREEKVLKTKTKELPIAERISLANS